MALFATYFETTTTPPAHLSDLVPWRMLAAPGVILQKEGHALQRTYRVRGYDLVSETPEVQGAKMLQANNVLKRLGGRWMLQSEAQRQRFTAYPQGTSTVSVATLLDAERRQTLVETPGSRETTYYLTLTWYPPSQSTHALTRLWVTGLPEAQPARDTEGSQLATFVEQADYLMDLCRSVLAVCAPLTTNEMLTYLHSCVSDRWHQVRCPGSVLDIDTWLCDTSYVSGWYPQLGAWHMRTCSLLGYPAMSFVGMIRALDSLDLDYRWCTRWLGMEKAVQRSLLTRTQHAWVHQEKSVMARMAESVSGSQTRVLDSDATRKAEEMDAARQEVGADIVAYGDFTSTVTVWDIDPAEADRKLRDIMQTFEAQGFTLTQETVHAAKAWLSSHPGNRRASVRRSPQHTLTLAHLTPGLAAAWPGPDEDAYLQQRPWFLAHTDTSGVFRVVNHVRDVGHFLVLGATGAGKSTFGNFVRAQWMLYRNAQATLFDLDGHGRLLTYLLGGQWLDLGSATVRLQPLRHVDDPLRRGIALQWVLDVLDEYHVPQNAAAQAYVGTNLAKLARLPAQERTISRLVTLMADGSRETELKAKAGRIDAQGISHPDMELKALVTLQSEIRTVLKRFTCGGDFEGVFDGDTDVLEANAVQTFELSSVLKRPRLLGPMLRYLFPQVEYQMSTERPMLLLLDDAAIPWKVAAIRERSNEWLMTTRKKAVSLGFMTHSLSQVFSSPLGELLEEGCPTRFFLPMPSALEPNIMAIYQRMGLTPQAIQQIATARPQQDVYYACTELGHRLCHLNFSPLLLDSIAANTAADHALMDRLLAEEGREGFAPAWYRARGYSAVAERLERECHATTHRTGVGM
jgi:type IV secretion system protein VirB4